MSWSIGCCFVCLFFDYFFSVGGCVFLCRIFFMSRYADALCIGPWRMICVVMHRMWVTMAKSMSMAGIVMGRCGIRMSTNDNNHLHHPPTPPTQQKCSVAISYNTQSTPEHPRDMHRSIHVEMDAHYRYQRITPGRFVIYLLADVNGSHYLCNSLGVYCPQGNLLLHAVPPHPR